MTSKLSLYKGALRLVGEKAISTLSDSVESRRMLDEIWDDGLVDYVLEQGLWNFATRTIELTYSPSIEPSFGYTYAFDKPTDFVRLAAICSDEAMRSPLLDYKDEQAYWFANNDTLYISYISNDADYGNDLSLWPQTVVTYTQTHMARQLGPRLNLSDVKMQWLEKELRRSLSNAKAKDAMNQAAQFIPTGTWVGARITRSGKER